jgi:hypothetical protein
MFVLSVEQQSTYKADITTAATSLLLPLFTPLVLWA